MCGIDPIAAGELANTPISQINLSPHGFRIGPRVGYVECFEDPQQRCDKRKLDYLYQKWNLFET